MAFFAFFDKNKSKEAIFLFYTMLNLSFAIVFLDFMH